MEFKFIRFILGAFLVLVAVMTHTLSGEVLHGPERGQGNATANKGSIIVYRENSNDTKSLPVVFINDRIVASLLPGEYAKTRVCDSKIKLRIGTRGAIVAKGELKRIDIHKNAITYIKIEKRKNNTFIPLVVDSVEAKQALQTIDQTDNVINRNIPKLALGTDSLFVFNSTQLLHSSYPTLDKLIRDINMCPNQVNRIKVIGHTDRIGNQKVNEKLSVKRAQVVAEYLTKHGLKVPMDVEGRGSREPVTTKCRGRVSPQLIQCLQPDRRVVIEY